MQLVGTQGHVVRGRHGLRLAAASYGRQPDGLASFDGRLRNLGCALEDGLITLDADEVTRFPELRRSAAEAKTLAPDLAGISIASHKYGITFTLLPQTRTPQP